MSEHASPSAGCLRVLFLLAVLVTLPVFLYLAGILAPKALIGTGVDQFRGQDKRIASAVYDVAHGDLFDGDSPNFLFISALRVESARSVKRCPSLEREAEFCGDACDLPPDKELREEMNAESPGAWRDYQEMQDLGLFVGKVRVYTLFGVPYETMTVTCEGELGEA